jgi:hypothetical protein
VRHVSEPPAQQDHQGDRQQPDRAIGNPSLLAVVGPDAYGYAADATSFENINLAPGGPGVFAIPLSGEDIDDVSVPVDLAATSSAFTGRTSPATTSFSSAPTG